jgi:glycosyltransferase involved in cell wall biosynthesis
MHPAPAFGGASGRLSVRVALHTPFVLQKNTGITRYIFGLLRALASVDRKTEYVCFWPPQAPWPDDLGPNFTPEPLTIAGGNPVGRVLREQRWIAAAYRRRPFDVLHSPFGYLPLRTPASAVVTLPDLRALRLPRSFSPLRGRFLRWIIPRSLRRARLVLAMSEATRREALALVSGLGAERVRVAYPGVDARWFEPVSADRVAVIRARLGLPPRFALAVSTREPHKNLPRLLEAVATARQNGALADLQLVLAGATFATGTSDDLATRIARLGLETAVRPLGIVPDDDLPAVYAAAAVLCFPSLYEGFGYPPLEAMAVGTPVVAARASCLPEVVGPAAELVDPLSPDDIARGLVRTLTDEARRAELVRAGRERAARYRWDDHARQVIAAYGDAAAAAAAAAAMTSGTSASARTSASG